jgi:hypothetical protein
LISPTRESLHDWRRDSERGLPGTDWWVITDPTNLYSQDDFPEMEQALIFHIGLQVFMAERERTDMGEDRLEHVTRRGEGSNRPWTP